MNNWLIWLHTRVAALLHRHTWQWQRQYFHMAPPWGRDGWVYQQQCTGCGKHQGPQENRGGDYDAPAP